MELLNKMSIANMAQEAINEIRKVRRENDFLFFFNDCFPLLSFSLPSASPPPYLPLHELIYSKPRKNDNNNLFGFHQRREWPAV